MSDYSVRYPRHVLPRLFLTAVGKTLITLLTRTSINGRENMPKDEAFILVGNHVAELDVPLLMLYAPRMVEMIEPADFPVDPSQQFVYRIWGGGIPIKQGGIDTRGLNMALDVLKQGGIIALFPEGGIWEANLKDAHAGASWLSHKAGVPVVPVGFGGTRGALWGTFRFEFPRVVMNIGKPIPPPDTANQPRRAALKAHTEQLMDAISNLIPESEKQDWDRIEDEQFDFHCELRAPDGHRVRIPANIDIQHKAALSKFFHRPVLLRTLERNLQLPVAPLRKLGEQHEPAVLADAVQVVLDYLDHNPTFLTYRFGTENGGAMQAGLRELHTLLTWAHAEDYAVILNPVRTYRMAYSTRRIVEELPA